MRPTTGARRERLVWTLVTVLLASPKADIKLATASEEEAKDILRRVAAILAGLPVSIPAEPDSK